ncbi:PREDICTED: LOW QUALITY PROTEIN: CMRF35-like molecule 1 [Lipotes vexillifer]|uniref:LOW QUALITY PROTEIN: CMRF35-like molecule 1 n=1 Tax=Lipotes vexillifer TaxID=118797 RepID=A0A340X3E6_LIPVE|nr:PREDICTED: LOW QUALITY PROTEIN: CMRF35-like molecule 1 [Lipotes vexillifer]
MRLLLLFYLLRRLAEIWSVVFVMNPEPGITPDTQGLVLQNGQTDGPHWSQKSRGTLVAQERGSSAITGPKAMSSLEGGSLTVQCQYTPEWENSVKWWCRGAAWSSCKFVVKTTGSEKEVKKDRVSIRDNRKSRTITVIMEKLRLNDADTYWCGIEKFGTDLGVQVKVTIDPAPTTVPATAPATSAINMFTVPVSLEETSGSPAVTSPGSNSGSVLLKASTLLPFISAVLLLLLMVASLVVWRMLKRQKKAAGISPEQEHQGPNVSDKPCAQMAMYSWPSCKGRGRGQGVLQPLEGDICYANLSLQQTENSGSSRNSTRPSSPAQASTEEVQYVTMASFPREDMACAALSLETSDQEPTYSNMGQLITRIPSRSHEEPTEYSTIRGRREGHRGEDSVMVGAKVGVMQPGSTERHSLQELKRL